MTTRVQRVASGKDALASEDVIAFEKSTNYNTIIQQEETFENHSLVGSPLSDFRRCPFWEQELAKKYSYKMVALLADEYCNYCQDILQNVRSQDLERVEDLLTSFWKSLQQDAVMVMSLPDVCQLFKCYDVQLYKGIEDILLHDFLEDVSIQYLKSVRLFSKKFKLWLLNALEGFPALLQISKLKEVTVFVKRLRRKTYLSNMAKTMKMVLKNNRRVHILKSDLHAILSQGALAVSEGVLLSHPEEMEELENRTEMKWDSGCPRGYTVALYFQSQPKYLRAVRAKTCLLCLSSLISLLGTSADLSVFLNSLSSDLQAFVFQPSRSKEEFIQLAASFQLRWNFLLTAVGKAMTLCHRDSFGSWHLFHLLLLEYVIHILQSCIEEEEEEEDVGNLREMLPENLPLVQPAQALFQPLASFPTQECGYPEAEPPCMVLRPADPSRLPTGAGSMTLSVLGFLLDVATGRKLVQVLLEDTATESAAQLSLPVGQEALITLKDGQKFVIHVSYIPQSSESGDFRDSNANV